MAGYIGNSPADSSVRIARQIYTTSGITSDFTFTSGYDPGYIDVYVNGERQTEGTNFTANDGSTITILNGGVSSGSTVECSAYKSFNVATVTLGEVTDVDDLTITGQLTSGSAVVGSAVTSNDSGINVSGAVTATSFVGDGSGLTGVASTDNITTSTPAEFQQINVSGIATIGVTTISTSVAVGAAVTISATAITVDPAVTTTIDGDVNFQGGNYNIARSRANSSIDFDDNAKARFGTGADFAVYFDGTNSYIDSDAGILKMMSVGGAQIYGTYLNVYNAAGSETIAEFAADGACNLYHDNSKKIETTATGVTVTGDVTATTFTGSGANLTNLPASGDSNDITACLFI